MAKTPRSPASRRPHRAEESASPAPAMDALLAVTRLLQDTNAKLAELMARDAPYDAAAPATPAALVNSWTDDPFSEAVPSARPVPGQPVAIAVPSNSNPHLAFEIAGPQPAQARHPPGTPAFRHWAAAEALTRGTLFWSRVLPRGTTWSAANPLPVTLLMPGQDLNANYSRGGGLRFFSRRVGGVDVHTCESPDVVSHELGHAILDAIRPQLFNAAGFEVWAFHESFGDMSAILCALQSPGLRAALRDETGGRLNVNSRLSRIAEQLGWGIRQLAPTVVDRDSLRNAANRFFYRRPDQLPSSAPATQLSLQEHSFSRVFTGAFLDALALMLAARSSADDQAMEGVCLDMGRVLVDAVRTAPVTADYFSQVAAAMVQADRARNQGRNRAALTRAFMERGILSVSSAMGLVDAPVPEEHPVMSVSAAISGVGSATLLDYPDAEPDESYRFGFGETPELPLRTAEIGGLAIDVHAPQEPARFSVASAAFGAAALHDREAQAEPRLFLEALMLRGQVGLSDAEVPARAKGVLLQIEELNEARATHVLVADSERLVLKRLQFSCACHRRSPWAALLAGEGA